jgi:hypothetical protein
MRSPSIAVVMAGVLLVASLAAAQETGTVTGVGVIGWGVYRGVEMAGEEPAT